jgi:hypothetical protein
MKIERLAHDPGTVADFYEESLAALGALCERTWHDRLEVVAEARSAKLWNDSGQLHEVELWFPPPDDTAPRDSAKEVFPGCPLTFRLAEAFRSMPINLERIVLQDALAVDPPAADVAEKLWRVQFPETRRWRLTKPFAATNHFSLLALVRCEIQAIDQHWSLRRVAVSLPDGAPDDVLAQSLELADVAADPAGPIDWPKPVPGSWQTSLQAAVERDLDADLAAVQSRQSRHLRRELDRVDDYFERYEQELSERAARTGSENAKSKTAQRLAAAKTEHARRRADQVARHEIHVHLHADALLLVAEPAWRAELNVETSHHSQTHPAFFLPRTRQWLPADNGDEARLRQ